MPIQMPPPNAEEFAPGSVACGLQPAADKLILVRRFQKHSETIVRMMAKRFTDQVRFNLFSL